MSPQVTFLYVVFVHRSFESPISHSVACFERIYLSPQAKLLFWMHSYDFFVFTDHLFDFSECIYLGPHATPLFVLDAHLD